MIYWVHMHHPHKKQRALCHSTADFSCMLVDVGVRPTKRRVAVLELFHTYGRLSAEEVVDKLKVCAMNRVTVYRIIRHLADAGVLVRATSEHAGAHYELYIHHVHTISCNRCGATEDLPHCVGVAADNAALAQSTKFAAIQQHNMTFFGTCQRCAAGH